MRDSTVQIAFFFHSEDVWPPGWEVSSGWYIDDVKVLTGPVVFNNPEGFESGLGDWYAETGTWEVGVPTTGPGSACVGLNMAATVLGGNYHDNVNSRFISPLFRVPSSALNPALRFIHWFSFNSGDYGKVQVKVEDGAWQDFTATFSGTSSGICTPFWKSLSAYADSVIQIAFFFHSEDVWPPGWETSSGWYIDKVQIDGSCTYTVTPTSATFPPEGGTDSVKVETQPNCTWTAVSNDTSWITILSGNQYTGADTVIYKVEPNTGGSERRRTMTIAELPFVVDQAASDTLLTVKPDSGLVAYWPFTGNANDSSGNGNDGIVNGATLTVDRGGCDSSAYFFDATQQNFIDGNDSLNSVNLPFSISGWIYNQNDGGDSPIFTSDDTQSSGSGNYYGFWLTVTGNKLSIGYGDGRGAGSSNRRSKNSSSSAPLNQWVHVAAVIRGPVDMSLYINAQDSGGSNSGSSNRGMVHSSFPMRIGMRSRHGPFYFDGSLDEIRIYNRALNTEEIKALYGGKGDVNFDSIINVLDVTLVTNISQGTFKPSPAEFWAADCHEDGVVDSLDVQCVVDLILNGRCVEQERIIRVVDTGASSGSKVEVPIVLESQGNENALGFSMSFDPNVLSNPTATHGSDDSSADLIPNSSEADSGCYGIALTLPTGQSFQGGTQEIVLVTFQVNSNTIVDSTVIAFKDKPIPRSISDAKANALSASWQSGTLKIFHNLEADVAPRFLGDRNILAQDWTQVGRFVARLDTPHTDINEFQRADCAPKPCGNGILDVSDWVQAGRYFARLDTLVPACGPKTPTSSIHLVSQGYIDKNVLLSKTSGSRTVQIDSAKFQQGKSYELAVMLNAQGDENAIGFSISFDPAILEYDTSFVANDTIGFSILTNPNQKESGRIGFLLRLNTNDSLSAGLHKIINISFKVDSMATLGSTSVSFGDDPIPKGISDVNANTLSVTWSPGEITITSVQEIANGSTPATFKLSQNYPNPFNPTTTIEFSLPQSGHVTLKIFDLLGREVAVLVDAPFATGHYKVDWDAGGLESGMYFYRIQVGHDFAQTKKLILMK